MASPASLAFQGNHVLNELASAGTDRRMPLACRRRLPPSAASTLFPDDRCFSLPRAARLATAFASIRLGSQGLTQAGGSAGHGSNGKASGSNGSKGGGSGGQRRTGNAEPDSTGNGAQTAAAEQSSAAEDLILLDVSGVLPASAFSWQQHKQRACC